jgi:predicted RNA-binding protein (virulence factor B family)
LRLRVNYVNQIGAFMDWGMEKTFWCRLKNSVLWKKEKLFGLPYMDDKTNRLVASSKTNQFLKMKSLLREKRK